MQSEKSVLAESVIDTTADRIHSGNQLAGQNGGQPAPGHTNDELAACQPGEYNVIRRNGKVTAFNASKISVAITKAFLEVEGGTAAASTRVHEKVKELTGQVVRGVTRRLPSGGTVHIEDIQDQVELALMRTGEQKVARAYVIYREERARARTEKDRDAEIRTGRFE